MKRLAATTLLDILPPDIAERVQKNGDMTWTLVTKNFMLNYQKFILQTEIPMITLKVDDYGLDINDWHGGDDDQDHDHNIDV